jgi:hypothetical protein
MSISLRATIYFSSKSRVVVSLPISIAMGKADAVDFMFAAVVRSYKEVAKEEVHIIALAIIHFMSCICKLADHSAESTEQRKKLGLKPSFRDCLIFQNSNIVS